MAKTLFMAFKTSQSSEASASFDRYIGVTKAKVLAVNPTEAELSSIYGRDVKVAPYVNTVDREGKKVAQARIDFILLFNAPDEKPVTTKLTFFITNEFQYNSDKTKVKCIDRFGRTAWASVAVAKAGEPIMYANGPADIDTKYRPLYRGEENVEMFIRKYLCIPDVRYFDNKSGEWKLRENTVDCEGVLDKVADLFSEKFAELKDILTLAPENEVRVMLGIRNTDDNRQFQAVYDRWFETARAREDSAIKRFEKSLSEEKANGALKSSDYEACPLKVFTNEPTAIAAPSADASDDLPMDNDPWGNE